MDCISDVVMTDLERLFYPRSVAVVGLSNDSGSFSGRNWIDNLLQLRFKGQIYPVSRTIKEYRGLKVYQTITEIPGDIDLIIISVPVQYTTQTMDQCVQKAAGFAQIYTAGFSEIGERGAAIEKEITEIAKKGGVRIVGPNCMGVYCPDGNISWRTDFPSESGEVALLSQSGFNAVNIINLAASREVRFTKVVSYGNAADLNETDFIDYFAGDPESKVIGIYVEGIRSGVSFVEALRKMARIKPVIVLKGGYTQAGARAAQSHTASLTTSTDIWKSMLLQVGAVEALDLTEFVDTTLAFLHLPPIKTKGVALIGSGGGTGVLGADACEKAGLTVPPLPTDIINTLSQFIPEYGTSVKNPIDLPFAITAQHFLETINAAASYDDFASLIIHFDVDTILLFSGETRLIEMLDVVVSAALDCDKPVVVVLRASTSPEGAKIISEWQHILVSNNVPVFPTIDQAAKAISNVINYYRRKS